MLNIQSIREINPKILILGNYPVIQSILDYDYLSGKKEPSIIAIITSGKNYQKYFFGTQQILIPTFRDINKLPPSLCQQINLSLNVLSNRRVLNSTQEILQKLPNLIGSVIFAENLPEKHSINLYHLAQKSHTWILGPSSIGLLVPKKLKLGVIGGIEARQFLQSNLLTNGDTAVLSASGGMTGELMSILAKSTRGLSFALSFGGDRFPILTPKEAFLAAQADPQTKSIIYYGELGGYDEYEIIELLKTKQLTKEVICYIGGAIAALFPQSPQFGHAKAMAKNDQETAQAKQAALKAAGAKVGETFSEFVELINSNKHEKIKADINSNIQTMIDQITQRKEPLITTSISADVGGQPTLLGEPLLDFARHNSFPSIVGSLFLGKKLISKDTENFIDIVLKLAVDHGPYVSGAINTIITARAGRDLVSSLAAGLLTIGPRFGGATNEAADHWLTGVTQNIQPAAFVEQLAKQGRRISGIGHKKYRIDQPDPRVKLLMDHTKDLTDKRFTNYALEIEKLTTAKKGNLILNVDGTIACVMLDILSEKEKLTDEKLGQLVSAEFFNAIFVLSRSVGFIAHFLDQKRLDEGLFRMPEDLVSNIKSSTED